ncbi:hypothetical protein BHE74_00026214 [Ensete ventricosum]|nr:hypothetical protein BHE74_00026214 [Ensete ventricosum]
MDSFPQANGAVLEFDVQHRGVFRKRRARWAQRRGGRGLTAATEESDGIGNSVSRGHGEGRQQKANATRPCLTPSNGILFARQRPPRVGSRNILYCRDAPGVRASHVCVWLLKQVGQLFFAVKLRTALMAKRRKP